MGHQGWEQTLLPQVFPGHVSMWQHRWPGVPRVVTLQLWRSDVSLPKTVSHKSLPSLGLAGAHKSGSPLAIPALLCRFVQPRFHRGLDGPALPARGHRDPKTPSCSRLPGGLSPLHLGVAGGLGCWDETRWDPSWRAGLGVAASPYWWHWRYLPPMVALTFTFSPKADPPGTASAP